MVVIACGSFELDELDPKCEDWAFFSGWSLGEEVLLGCVLASKKADLASKRLTKLETAGVGPARPLRRSSQQKCIKE
ncbi:hypothetical protein PIB30_033001 [Stylosanthes scabra]|uniref:Uncharacterized protein n=1 Tax=Stylosanthes scabra TaxID=79078 RepID=A0ABU6UB50_9FABA|nr:hypothetical protein [Stylosanthes scabra]